MRLKRPVAICALSMVIAAGVCDVPLLAVQRLGGTGAAPMALLLFGLLRWRRSTRASRAQ